MLNMLVAPTLARAKNSFFTGQSFDYNSCTKRQLSFKSKRTMPSVPPVWTSRHRGNGLDTIISAYHIPFAMGLSSLHRGAGDPMMSGRPAAAALHHTRKECAYCVTWVLTQMGCQGYILRHCYCGHFMHPLVHLLHSSLQLV